MMRLADKGTSRAVQYSSSHQTRNTASRILGTDNSED